MPYCKKCFQAIPSILLIVLILWTYYTFLVEFCIKELKEFPTRRITYLVVGNLLFFMLMWCFLHVMFCMDNFVIPQEFKLSRTEHDRLLSLPSSEQSGVLEQYVQKRHISVWLRTSDNLIRYCTKCRLIKPDRTHHCSACDQCVLKMDHHCPWTNNCVGHVNQKSFMLTLMYGISATLVYAIQLIEYYLYIGVIGKDTRTYILFSGTNPLDTQTNKSYRFVTAISLIVLMSVLFCQHLSLLLKNVTIIETIQDTHFVNPRLTFNLGNIENFLDVFGEYCCKWWIPNNSSYGNGVNFEVRYKR